MPQNLLSGKTGFVNTGAGNYSFGKWEADIQTKMIPTPNFNGAGFMQKVPGLTESKITIDGPYDQGNMPFTSGNTYTWVLGLVTGVSISITGLLAGIKMSEDVEGNPRVTLTVESTGAFTPSIT